MGFNYCSTLEVKSWLSGLDTSEMVSNLDSIIEQVWIPWAKRQVDLYCGENFDNTTIDEFYDGNGLVKLPLRHRPISFVRKVTLRIIPSIEWFDFRRWFHTNTIDQLGVDIAQRGGVEPVGLNPTTPYLFINTDPVPADLKTTNPLLVTGQFNNTTAQYERSDLFINCRLGMLEIPPRILFLENQAVPFWNYTWLRGNENIEIEYDYGYRSIDLLPVEFRNACAQFVAAAVLQNKGLFLGGGGLSLRQGETLSNFNEVPYAGHIKMYLENARQTLLSYKRIRV